MDGNRTVINRSPTSRHLKKSNHSTEIEMEQNVRMAKFQQSHKHLTFSTFLDIYDEHTPFIPTTRLERIARVAS